jgi:hypothetical protein
MSETKLYYAKGAVGSWWVAAKHAEDVKPLIFHYEGSFGAGARSRLETVRDLEIIEFSPEDARMVTLDAWDTPRTLDREFEEMKGCCEVGVISQGKH